MADTHAGKKGRCPHCASVVQVPQTGETPSAGEPERPDESGSAPALSEKDRAFLDLPNRSLQATSEDSLGVSTIGIPTESEYAGQAEVETPAGPTDVFLYPTSADGLIHMGILVLALLAIGLFRDYVARFLGPYAGLLVLILQLVLGGYMLFYLSFCVYDSSRGGRRAPSVALGPMPDRGEVLSQMLLLLASTAISFWPAAVYYGLTAWVAVYYGLTARVDVWCMLLAVACAFFWPMALLAAILFDGIDALNPLLIVRSIIVTLPAYVVLVLKLGVVATGVIVVRYVSSLLPIPQAFWNAVHLYLLLIGAHLLGRHYRRHRARLDWGL